MNNLDTMKRLRAARPADTEASDHHDLFTQIVAEPGDSRLAQTPRRSFRLMVLRRPHVVAGGSLGLAGVATAAVLAFTGGTAAPAFAVTREGNGTLLVTLTGPYQMLQVDEQLVELGSPYEVGYQLEPGPETSTSPIRCQVVGDGPPAAPVEMRLGSDNQGTTTVDNTGLPAGTVHLVSCNVGDSPNNSGDYLDAMLAKEGQFQELHKMQTLQSQMHPDPLGTTTAPTAPTPAASQSDRRAARQQKK